MSEPNTLLSEKDRKTRERILNDPIMLVVIRIAAPLAFFQLLSQLVAFLDTLMAGHINALSVSAVAYMNQLFLILSAIGDGLAVGAAIEISKDFGEGNYAMVKKRVSTVYTVTVVLCILLAAVFIPLTVPFLKLCQMPQELIAAGKEYFQINIIVLAIRFFNGIYIAIQRSRGNTKLIMRLNIAVIIIKLILTAVFVYGANGTLMHIAVATLISQIPVLFFAVKSVVTRHDIFGFSASAVTKEKEVMAPVLSRSFPVTVDKILFPFGKAIVNALCGSYGPLMVGALGVSNMLGGLTTKPMEGITDGTATVISQNLGAGKTKRAIGAFQCAVLIAVIGSFIISSLEYWNLSFLSRLLANGNTEFAELIVKQYRWEVISAVPLGFCAAALSLLYGSGYTRMGMDLNIVRIFIFRIPPFLFIRSHHLFSDSAPGFVMFFSNTISAVLAGIAVFIAIKKIKHNDAPASPPMQDS